MSEKATAAERKREAREYVKSVDDARKSENLSLDQATTKLGKTVGKYYWHKRVLAGKKVVIKAKTITRRRRRAVTNLPAVSGEITGFTEVPTTLRSAGTNKMLLAVAVGDAQEINKVLDSTLNRFFRGL